jgi:hypothetical protein
VPHNSQIPWLVLSTSGSVPLDCSRARHCSRTQGSMGTCFHHTGQQGCLRAADPHSSLCCYTIWVCICWLNFDFYNVPRHSSQCPRMLGTQNQASAAGSLQCSGRVKWLHQQVRCPRSHKHRAQWFHRPCRQDLSWNIHEAGHYRANNK